MSVPTPEAKRATGYRHSQNQGYQDGRTKHGETCWKLGEFLFQPKDVGQRLVTNQQLILVSYKPHFWASKRAHYFTAIGPQSKTSLKSRL